MAKRSTSNKKRPATKPRYKIIYKPLKRTASRAEGQTQTTISLSAQNLKNGREMAKHAQPGGRESFSLWVEKQIEREWLFYQAGLLQK